MVHFGGRRSPRRTPAIPSSVLAMLVFVFTEIMFFGGFISAYLIAKAAYRNWPPLGQPRLPIEETALNSLVLLASAVCLGFAVRAFKRSDPKSAKLLLAALLLGAFFVVFQGIEWVGLIAEGLTLSKSTHAGFFYLIVGAHALHAVVALSVLGWALFAMRRRTLRASGLWAAQIFWYFVVGVWPILYVLVYL